MSEVKILRDMPFSAYDDLKGVNASSVKTLVSKGILGLFMERDSSKALDVGTSIHALVLDGVHDYAVNPYDGRAKEGREWVKEQRAKGVKVYDRTTSSMIEAVRDSIYYSPAHDWLKALSDTEVSVQGKIDGVNVKARYDGMFFETGLPEFILDLKSTSAFDSFDTDFYKYGYDIQADFYRMMWQKPEQIVFVFVVAETVAPYRVKVVTKNRLSHTVEEIGELVRHVNAVRAELSSDIRRFANSEHCEVAGMPSWVADRRRDNVRDCERALSLLVHTREHEQAIARARERRKAKRADSVTE